MNVNSNLTDLLRALNEEGAEYLIIGGYALAVHGHLRATKDVDIFVGTDPENAARVYRALIRFGAPLETLARENLTEPDVFFIMGRPPNQIDVITSIDGVTFETAWQNRVESTYDGVPVAYIARADLIANKAASGRTQDLSDLEALRRLEDS
jgi:predicted nucleotidyltransferase